MKGATREGLAEAIELFEKALSLDPGSIDTKAFLAAALAGRVLEQLSETAADDIDRAEQLVEQVLAVSPRHPLAHFAKAQILRAQRQYAAAIPEYEIAIAANRNWVVAIANLGICKFLAGRIEEAIPAQELAIRLVRAIRGCPIGIGGSAWSTCCNRGSTKRSSGWNGRAAQIRACPARMPGWHRPMR